MKLLIAILILLARSAFAQDCTPLPRLSMNVSSYEYNQSGVSVSLNHGDSKTYCGVWYPAEKGDAFVPEFITTSNVRHTAIFDIVGSKPITVTGTNNSKRWKWTGGKFYITVKDPAERAEILIKTNFPPGVQKTCVEKSETRPQGVSSNGTLTVKMPLGAPNPNGVSVPPPSSPLIADLTPLPMGEYIFEMRRSEPGQCNDRDNINLSVKSGSEKSSQPQEARIPPEAIISCSDRSATRIPWNNYARDNGIRDLYGYWGNTSAAVGKSWKKFCFWVDKPDVYMLRFGFNQFGTSQCAVYHVRVTPPSCKGSTSTKTYSTASGTYSYVQATKSSCEGKIPFDISWSSEGPTYTPAPNVTSTPLPSATVIPPDFSGADAIFTGSVGMDQKVLLSYQNVNNVKRLDFEVLGNGVTLSVAPPPNTLWVSQTPAKFIHLGTTDFDEYARVPKGTYGISVYGPTTSGTQDACSPPNQSNNWKLLRPGENGGRANGLTYFRFRLPRKATSLSFSMEADLVGNVTFFKGSKEIFKTDNGKANTANLGGDEGIYYVIADAYGDYSIRLSAYDASGAIPDGQPAGCGTGTTSTSFTVKIGVGDIGELPPATPTPVKTPVPTRTPIPTPTPTPLPPGIFVGENFKKENFSPYSTTEKLAAVLIESYPAGGGASGVVPPWADIVVVLYRGPQDNQTLANIVTELLIYILARQPHARIAPSMASSDAEGLRDFYSMFPAELWAGVGNSPVGQGDLVSGLPLYRKSFAGMPAPISMPDNVRFFEKDSVDEVRAWKNLNLSSSFVNVYVPNPQLSGQPKPARLRVRNTGTSTWHPPSNFSLVDKVSGESYLLTRTLYPNGEQDFFATIEAGRSYQWQMNYRGEGFGPSTSTYTITQIESSPTATPRPTPSPTPFVYDPPTPTVTPTPICPPGSRPLPPPNGIPGRCYPI